MNDTEFEQLAKQGYNRIPVVLTVSADLDTPLSVYCKLARRSGSFLLESVVGGERLARYSYIGIGSRIALKASGKHVTVTQDGTVIEHGGDADPLEFVRGFLRRYNIAPITGLPRFHGGLVGYFGYDTVRWIEPRLAAGWLKPDSIGCPDMLLLLCEELAVVDNLTGRLHLVVYADPGRVAALRDAHRRLDEQLALLRSPLQMPIETNPAQGPVQSNFAAKGFERAVARAVEYIAAGDAMQIVLSQRFTQAFAGSGLSLYRAVRAINPSPYMFFFDFGDFHVVGASPEILVRSERGTVTVRPLAGTRARGADATSDAALERELLADPKERAEHVMLLDLGRNDLGRVAVTGSVKVTEAMTVERYSHVMHIVSNVECSLEPGLDWVDVFRATFPAGTVSGAPKVRAMEVIDELEPERRGVYAGAIGYIGFDGTMDLAIAIRTAVLRGGRLHVQAGAGVVADSQPDAEATETRNKARAMLRAAETVIWR